MKCKCNATYNHTTNTTTATHQTISSKNLLMLSVILLFLISASSLGYAAHTSSAELQPEWSPANADVNYSVEISNAGPDSIYEVRIYKNSQYSNFVCNQKDGWELTFIPILQACLYVTDNASNAINNGSSTAFTFSARTPVNIDCSLTWKFETRDDQFVWKTVYDTTSVDDQAPIITKVVGDPQVKIDDNTYYITKDTPITLSATDTNEVERCPSSKIKSCEYRYKVNDGGFGNWIDWTDNLTGYTFKFGEDSNHTLEVRCTDNAGNVATLTEIDVVDTVAPDTTKAYGTPFVSNGTYHWINSSTPVEFKAIDPDPHPVGVDKLYWRNTLLHEVSDESCVASCSQFRGSGNFTEVPGDHATIIKPEESCHLIEYFAVDKLGNEETMKKQCVFVDNTAPVVAKEVGEPKLNGSSEDAHWLISTKTPITLSCTDPQPHPVDNVAIKYRYKVNNGSFGDWQTYANPFTFPEESRHTLEYYCVDALGNKGETQTEVDIVDNTPPAINVTVGEPKVQKGNDLYIRDNTQLPGTPVTVDVTDAGVHKTGLKYCEWSYTVNGDPVGKPVQVREYPFNITFPEDSTHVLTIKCYDNLGNMAQDVETYLVDSIAPNTTKKYGTPFFSDGMYDWINTSTPITLTAVDAKVGVKFIKYRVTQMDVTDSACVEKCKFTGTGDFKYRRNTNKTTFTIPEQSCHLIEFASEDLLENEEQMNRQCVFVDNSAPITTKTIGEPKVGGNGVVNVLLMHANYNNYMQDVLSKLSAYPDLNVDELDVKTQTPNLSYLMNYDAVFLYDNFAVADPVAMGNVLADYADNGGGVVLAVFDWYSVWKIEGRYMTQQYGAIPMGNTSNPYTSGTLGVFDSTHPIMQGVTAFNTSDYRSGTKYLNPGATLVASYTDGEVLVAVKENGTRRGCDLGFFPPSSEVINSWNNETDGSLIMRNCIVWAANVEGSDDVFVNQSTPITLNCNDPNPHPVEHETLFWSIGTNVTGSWVQGPWHNSTQIPVTINFENDSYHNIKYYCVDELGNAENVKTEIDIVDSVPPAITTTIVGPQYYNSTEKAQYIDGVTKVHVEAVDPEPHPVNNVKCDWSYAVRQSDARGGQTGVSAPFDINFPEESTHDLTITCRDALGNAATKYETYQVDKTPPVTKKYFEGPQYPVDKDTEGNAHWITSGTEIGLSVYDDGPHKSGIKETNYRVTQLDDDKYCWSQEVCQDAQGTGNWNAYTAKFRVPETSCHLIEYYSVDNVNKTETTKKQCVFVDNEAPTPNKTIGEPKAKWDGVNPQNVTYFPNLTERCKTEDCWKITTLTPITLSCDDPLPHPVDHSRISFSVNFDNLVNLTPEYCKSVSGTMGPDGYCTVNRDAPITLYFRNESNHNLKFYCTDILGNKNDKVDDEMFKVDGTRFDFNLYRKWNLISVPFVLLNDSIDELFKDVKGNISAVWTYDNGTWYVWTPGPAPDTLHSIKPGWGYWVLSNDRAKIWIGGSLFAPVTVPPEKHLNPGWNLIGFYGTEWQQYGEDPDCSYDVGSIFWDYTYNALNSLVDLQQGYPRWESLWTRVNCKNDQWIQQTQTNVFANKYNSKYRMVAGYGYWVHMDMPDEYSP